MTRNGDAAEVLNPSEVKLAEDLLRYIAAAIRNILFYPPGHRVLETSISTAHNAAASLMEGRDEIHIGALGDEWIVNNTLLHNAGSIAVDLRERMRARTLTSITLERGSTERDLEALARVLIEDPRSVKERGASAFLRSLGCSSVAVGRVTASPVTGEPEPCPAPFSPDDVPPELLRSSASAIAELYTEAVEGSTDLRRARAMLSDITDLVDSRQANLEALLNMKSHDDYTYTHIVNVCVLTLAQARGLNLGEEMLDDVGLAALMHDVGKQRVPAEIIRKPSRLTPKEFEIMQKHTIYGAEMLESMPGAPDLAAMVAFEHHLRYDCGGYPKIGRRRDLNLCTYLTMISDAFDAMRTLRPYSRMLTQQEVAIRMDADIGTHFEPLLLWRFLRMLDPFPVGSSVKLSTGEEGVVVGRTSLDYMKPVVKVTAGASGGPIEEGEEIDLAAPGTRPPTAVAVAAGCPGGGDQSEAA